MARLRAAVFAALLFLGFASPLVAQDITLTSPDGAVEISGTLLGFDGEFYRVDTQYGELTVDSSGVRCDGPGCPSLTEYVAELAFSGASVMSETLMPALIEGFALRNGLQARRTALIEDQFEYSLQRPDTGSIIARFYFRVTNTDEGFADLLANEADAVLALREIRSEERARARDASMGDMTDARRSRVVALDAIVPVVAPGNPVTEISPEDLAKVFAGQITNWQELGGPDAPITLHLPDERSGLSQAVEDMLLRPARVQVAENVQRHAISSTLARTVTTDPFGIGMASFAEIGTAKPLNLTGSCGFSLTATRRSIKTEDYPLTAPMFMYLPARRLPKIAREFLLYMRSPAAQIVIRRAGFGDQAPEVIPVNAQGDRLANAITASGAEVSLNDLQHMVAQLRPLRRLTTSFRFEPGSTRPDAQSRGNIQQLAREIEIGLYDAKRLVFVGFSDGDGPAAGNRSIAQKRAESIRDAVLNAVEVPEAIQANVDVMAFGEAMPMACDDTGWGRKVNRRVEVWLR
jgi:phosphate transport system substrate-binding protein